MNNSLKLYSLIKVNMFVIVVLLLFNGRDISNSLLVFNIYVGVSFAFVLALEIISLLLSCIYNKTKIDHIAFLLFLQILLYTLGFILFPDAIESMKYYLAALGALVVYMFCLVTSLEELNKSVLRLSEFSIVVISLQTISATLRAMGNNIPYYMMKGYIQIPVGGSNYIASFLMMFLIVVMNLEENKSKKILFMSLAVSGIIFTRSTSAMILIPSIFVCEYGRKFLFAKKAKEVVKNFLVIILLGFIFWKILQMFPDYFSRYTVGISNIFTDRSTGLEDVSNNRFVLYEEAIKMVRERLFLGYGLNYRNISFDASAHNLILDQVLKGGVLNAVLFLSYISILFYNFYKYRNCSKEIKTMGKMLLVVMINGMYELNLGGFNFDFFFWLFCGVGMANCYNYIKLKKDALIKKDT